MIPAAGWSRREGLPVVATCKASYGSVRKSAARQRSWEALAEFRIATDSPDSRPFPARCGELAKKIRLQPDVGIALADYQGRRGFASACSGTWRQAIALQLRVRGARAPALKLEEFVGSESVAAAYRLTRSTSRWRPRRWSMPASRYADILALVSAWRRVTPRCSSPAKAASARISSLAQIHSRSRARHGPFIAVNCAGLTETLLESELFGHVKGSFTGAYRDKPGKLQLAHRGTLFLDEVGEMSLRMQALLLRFLENGEIQSVGADHVQVDGGRARDRGHQPRPRPRWSPTGSSARTCCTGCA